MKAKKEHMRKRAIRWALTLLLWSFAISITLTLISSEVLSWASLWLAILVLLLFIAFGVLFDMFGIAVATASEKPFHSMAARRVGGSEEGLRFIRRADRVSSFCNDMVGDICGIISGTSSATIVAILIRDFSLSSTVTALIVSGLLAGLTVGGKALCKPIAMRHNTQIVLFVGRVIHTFKRRSKEK